LSPLVFLPRVSNLTLSAVSLLAVYSKRETVHVSTLRFLVYLQFQGFCWIVFDEGSFPTFFPFPTQTDPSIFWFLSLDFSAPLHFVPCLINYKRQLPGHYLRSMLVPYGVSVLRPILDPFCFSLSKRLDPSLKAVSPSLFRR